MSTVNTRHCLHIAGNQMAAAIKELQSALSTAPPVAGMAILALIGQARELRQVAEQLLEAMDQEARP